MKGPARLGAPAFVFLQSINIGKYIDFPLANWRAGSVSDRRDSRLRSLTLPARRWFQRSTKKGRAAETVRRRSAARLMKTLEVNPFGQRLQPIGPILQRVRRHPPFREDDVDFFRHGKWLIFGIACVDVPRSIRRANRTLFLN